MKQETEDAIVNDLLHKALGDIMDAVFKSIDLAGMALPHMKMEFVGILAREVIDCGLTQMVLASAIVARNDTSKGEPAELFDERMALVKTALMGWVSKRYDEVVERDKRDAAKERAERMAR